MRMNVAETLVVNSPLRAAVQRHHEARVLERLGGRLAGGTRSGDRLRTFSDFVLGVGERRSG